jgi:hypothetical protein
MSALYKKTRSELVTIRVKINGHEGTSVIENGSQEILSSEIPNRLFAFDL